jgi:hypothetical protein
MYIPAIVLTLAAEPTKKAEQPFAFEPAASLHMHSFYIYLLKAFRIYPFKNQNQIVIGYT